MMKIFVTNLSLKYNEYAILLYVENDDYLCIERYEFGVDWCAEGTYDVGKIYNMKDCEYGMRELKDYNITDSPLSGTFLFEHFLKTKN